MTEILIEGQLFKVSDDFNLLSPEDQAKTVDFIAKQASITAKNAGDSRHEGFFGQANRAIAGGLDAANPFNAVRGGVNAIFGTELPTDVKAGTDSFSALGIPVAQNPPEGILANAGAGAGNAALAIAPASGFLKAASVAKGLPAARGFIGQLSDDALRALSTTPGATVELLAGAGAGAGGEIAANAFGEGARTTGEIVGGLGLPTAAGAGEALGRVVQKLPVVGTASQLAQRTILPFAGPGARIAAGNRLRGVAESAEGALRNIEAKNIGKLTPAQQSGDPGLASLENRLAAESPKFSRNLREGTARSATILRDELIKLGGNGDINDAVTFISRRRDAFSRRLAGIVDSARERADRRIAKLTPNRPQSANSVIVREEIDRAFGQAKNQERNLWSRVPQDAIVPTNNAQARFQALVDETPTALAGDVPDEARRMFASNQGVTDEATVREMLGLVSRMRQVSRAARSGETPNANQARIADEIANGVLDDLENLPANSQRVAMAVAEARAFSRELAETFKQGAVNTIRQRRSTGRGSVPAEASLGVTVGSSGPRGAVAARDIRTATGGATDEATEDFLRGQISDRAVRDSGFSDRAAETFQRQNRDTLEEFPAVRDDISAARAAAADLSAREGRIKSITDRLNDRNQSVGAAFIKSSPGREVAEAVFAARNPTAAARQIRNAVARDSSGAALDGVKTGFLDNLIRGSSAKGIDEKGRAFVSGSRLTTQLQDSRLRGALAQVFTPDELRRADRLAAQLLKIERAQSAGQATAIIDDLPNNILTVVARVLGAKAGARLGGGGGAGVNLQAAQIGSGRARRLLQSLTNDRAEDLLIDAVKDPTLMSALLRNTKDPRAQEAAIRRINSWLIGTGAVTATEEQQ